MSERYDQDPSLPNDDALDEYLCEYVDGTMDPAVRAAFEDFLSANPALQAHVQRLQRTRAICSRQHCAAAPRDLQHRLRAEIARDLMGDNGPVFYLPRLGHFAVLTSLLALSVLIGVVVGASLLDRPVSSRSEAGVDRTELPAVPSDAYGRPSSTTPSEETASIAVAGPVRALPVLDDSDDVTPIAEQDSLAEALAMRTAQLAR